MKPWAEAQKHFFYCKINCNVYDVLNKLDYSFAKIYSLCLFLFVANYHYCLYLMLINAGQQGENKWFKNITLWVKIKRCKLTYLLPVMGELRCQELTWIVPDQINNSLNTLKEMIQSGLIRWSNPGFTNATWTQYRSWVMIPVKQRRDCTCCRALICHGWTFKCSPASKRNI